MMRQAPGAVLVALIAVLGAVGMRGVDLTAVSQATPEDRAVAFLSVEVPRWRAENNCYSCHNNGDAVRALIQAARRGYDVSRPLADTLAFLANPDGWANNSRGGPLDDQGLAQIQFAGAVTDAVAAELLPVSALASASALLAAGQDDDGSWRLDDSNSIGSPATYGRALATWSARRTLVASRSPDAQAAIDRADRWIRAQTPRVTPDLAAVLLALEGAEDAEGVALRDRTLATLVAMQGRGGWGPYANARAEPFDTAVALLALYAQPRTLPLQDAIDRGRAYLRESALPDGSWLETTRPAGQASYAQLISTAGWATVALLSGATDGRLANLERDLRLLRPRSIVDLVEAIDFE